VDNYKDENIEKGDCAGDISILDFSGRTILPELVFIVFDFVTG